MLLLSTVLIIALLIGFCAGAWATAAYQVRKGQTDFSWPGRRIRVVELDPSEFSHGWERKP